MNEAKHPIREWRGVASMGYFIIILSFGVFGVWAAVAKLDKAVVAPAFVAIETNHKTIQHFEGGIVREILVNEGDHVKEGTILLRLQKVQAQANSDLLKKQLDSNLALEARLLAERDSEDGIAWPKEFMGRSADPVLAGSMSDQEHQFRERHASLDGQVSVLGSRIEQFANEIRGVAMERQSTERQVKYIDEELINLHSLANKQLVPMTRVYAMEREKTRLEGVIGRSIADSAKAESSIGEMKIHIQQLRQKFQEDVAASLLDVRQKIAGARERVTVAEDVLSRVELVAPRTGTVQNLKVFTLGQVIRSGDALLDIVPDDERLVIHAQFSPTEIDSVYAGQQAEIRFPAFHSREIPVILGQLQSISNDRILDEQSHQFYFLGVISLNRADIPQEYRKRIRSGMPAEVIVASGERTVLSYFISPLAGSIRKAFREQ